MPGAWQPRWPGGEHTRESPKGSEEGGGGGRKGGEPRRRVDFLKVGGMETLSHTENEGQ